MTEKIRDHPQLGRGHLTKLDDRLVLAGGIAHDFNNC